MLVLLSGVSGAGKDTIKKELIKRMDNVISLPSYTTRAMREGDVAGETYNFVSKEVFEQMIENGELYEYDLHHENYYGTSRKLMNEKIQSGKIIVKDMDVNGVENLINILRKDTKVVTIFLRVPKDVLEARLRNRVDAPSDEEIEMRLSRFEYEESKISTYDYIMKNNDLEKSLAVIQTIIEKEYKLKETEF
ncbi:MAG: AAA family ATPase [Clostridia bacterium]|nr:AAA family ATPase [Clostridia bacterium]